MKKLYFLLFFSAAFSINSLAQSSETKGQNPNPDAPVNLSEPALRPAQPAQYSSTPVENKGQFYIVNDKPADAQGNKLPPPVTPPDKASPSKLAQPAKSKASNNTGEAIKPGNSTPKPTKK